MGGGELNKRKNMKQLQIGLSTPIKVATSGELVECEGSMAVEIKEVL